LSFITGY